MAYFTWKETGLTSDCASLEAMAARFEEAAGLMRRMASEGLITQIGVQCSEQLPSCRFYPLQVTRIIICNARILEKEFAVTNHLIDWGPEVMPQLS